MSVDLIEGDCREAIRELAGNSIDSCVTDPPYALVSISKRFGKDGAFSRASRGFMGKTWDNGDVAHDPEFWAEVLRVLKPGGHVLAFAGTRTYHRLACAIEDAGFEIRDQIGWVYSTGFPKSHNQHGEWEGWGSALKPAWEPIVMARKPLAGTIEGNLREWGVGAINIDGCRVDGAEAAANASPLGRWPANLIHDGSDEVVAAFPAAPGQLARSREDGAPQGNAVYGAMKHGGPVHEPRIEQDKSAARFFYSAKASKKDRDEGLPPATNGRANTHPTVKPTALMQYLCRLVTPPGGVVLDPFMGSGSTGRGAVLEGLSFIGVEMDANYFDIADARIAAAERRHNEEKPNG